MLFRCAKTDQDIVEVHDLIEEQFCDVCNRSHFDSKHESSIVHLVRLNERPAEGYAYGIEMSNPGYRLLKLKQWNEGEGLGSGNNKGRRYPVSVCFFVFFKFLLFRLEQLLSGTRKAWA